MIIQDILLSELKPYANNPRNNEQAIDGVAESIKQFGFKVPIIIDNLTNKEIIAGHTRYKASQKLGLERVPCIVADDLTEEQVRAFRLADNKVAEKSEWNFDLLDEELKSILNIDMEAFGFDLGTDADEEEVIEDIPPEVHEEAKSKLGEIYELGNHRLMVGDSTDAIQVGRLMAGAEADLVVTDPPYNVDIGIEDIEEAKIRKRRTDGKSIQNDKMSDDDFREFLEKAFGNINLALKKGGAFYICFASREHVNFETALVSNGLQVKQELIWVKNSLILGRQDYQWIHEPILYGWKEGAGHYFTDDRTQTTVIEDKGYDFDKMKKQEAIELLKEIFAETQPTTIIHENKPVRSELHPTMKPIKLLARFIRNSSRENELVLDLFGGSGSTLIACEQLNRRCYMMEYDPKYADSIIERWEAFTGQKARKING